MKNVFVKTKNVKKLVTFFNEVQNLPPNIPKLALVYGEHGLGKTHSIIWWATRNDAIYVRANNEMTQNGLLKAIVEELGERAYFYMQENYNLILKHLKQNPQIVIVDEVDYFATVWKDKVYFIPIDETSMVKTIRADDETYLSETIFSMYKRLSDTELYNYTEEKVSKNYCIDCGCEIAHTSERCVSCFNKLKKVIERPTREELKKMLRTKTFLQIGKDYGVSDNAVRKWCDKEQLPRKMSEIKKFSEEEWKNI